MPSFSQGLELTLRRAVALANQRGRQVITPEHLLLALLNDNDAARVFMACAVDLELLRFHVTDFVNAKPASSDAIGRPERVSTDFQRIVHRALTFARAADKEWVTGANILVALFAERGCPAVLLLKQAGMTCFDAVQYLSHGIIKRAITPQGFAKHLAEDVETL